MTRSVTRIARRAAALALAGVAALSAAPGARAQEEIGIVAIVNDDPISAIDLFTRIRLAMLSAGIEPSQQTQQRMAPQVLQTLIDEILQRQEAKRLGLAVTQGEIDQALDRVAQGNGLTRQDLLSRVQTAGIPLEALTAQIRSNIAWVKVVQSSLGSQVEVTPGEIDSELDKLRSQSAGQEVRLSEILLPIPQAERAGEVFGAAQNLVEQFRAGSNFNALAQQFSRSSSAQNGGLIPGWLSVAQLDPEIRLALDSLEPGGVSPPVRARAGYYIVRLEERRSKQAQTAPTDVEAVLKQVFVPLAPDMDPQTVAQLTEIANRARTELRGCADIPRVNARYGLSDVSELGIMTYSEMQPPLRAIVEPLPVDAPSAPLRLEAGIAILLVCERREIDPNLPPREQVGQKIRLQKMEQLAQRYMRDLRRSAIVDVRIN